MTRFVSLAVFTLTAVGLMGTGSVGQPPPPVQQPPSFEWSTHPSPRPGDPNYKLISPQFVLVNQTSKKTKLIWAEGKLTIPPGNGACSATNVKFRLWVAEANNVWGVDPNFEYAGNAASLSQNVYKLTGNNTTDPQTQFDQAVDVKLEFTLDVTPSSSQSNPNPKAKKYVVGTIITKPTARP